MSKQPVSLENKKFELGNLYDILDKILSVIVTILILFFVVVSTLFVFTNQSTRVATFSPWGVVGLVHFLVLGVYTLFLLGATIYFRNLIRLRKYFSKLKEKVFSLPELVQYSEKLGKELPKICIFVPARNEGYVIENTIRRLIKLDYPKNRYYIFIIVDERELDDDVDVFTKDVVVQTRMRLSTFCDAKFIECIEVPKWYSGNYKNTLRTFKKSTKGRALNYALQVIDSREDLVDIEMIGVLDADGRLDVDTLKEVAWKRLEKNTKILQGPVFQVSNFLQIKIVGVAAGLELAIHHMTELPSRLHRNKTQFLAGTNYFIDRNLITSVGGWNQNTLVEDAELALRIYMQTGIKAQWLSCPEIEQSPENFSVYRKQRERWVRGHLYLVSTIITSALPFYEKVFFIWEIATLQLRFFVDFLIPLTALTMLFLGIFSQAGYPFNLISIFLICVSLLIFDTYGYMYRKLGIYIDSNISQKDKLLKSVKLFFYFPIFMFVQAIPRFDALKNYLFKPSVEWYKTKRTKEIITE